VTKKVPAMAVLGGLAMREVYAAGIESELVVTPFGLHSGLRQSGGALARGFYGPTEAGPFRYWRGGVGSGIAFATEADTFRVLT
jgi:hypothetical protein